MPLNITKLNGNMTLYHFNHTGYYWFNVNYTSFMNTA